MCVDVGVRERAYTATTRSPNVPERGPHDRFPRSDRLTMGPILQIIRSSIAHLAGNQSKCKPGTLYLVRIQLPTQRSSRATAGAVYPGVAIIEPIGLYVFFNLECLR